MTLSFMSRETLYPPFETESNPREDNNMLLSKELKRSFDTVRDIDNAQKRLKKIKRVQDIDSSDGINEVNEKIKQNKLEKEDLEARKFEAAVAAAIAAESEISSLSNGIVELEAMLLRQESGEGVSHEKFPALPSEYDTKKNYVPQGDG
jgi:hypothetical protein|eukprot:147540_1